jgi:hypothetical protein
VILRVTVGKGVKVAVGGNQTTVAVGVWLGGSAVLLGRGASGAETGRQAVRPARPSMIKPAQNIQRMILVYYGKGILGKERPVRWTVVRIFIFTKNTAGCFIVVK